MRRLRMRTIYAHMDNLTFLYTCIHEYVCVRGPMLQSLK